MLRAWDIPWNVYTYRISHGYTIEEILKNIPSKATGFSVAKRCVDDDGKVYRSFSELASNCGLARATLRKRLKRMPLKEAKVKPVKYKKSSSYRNVRDHLGNKFKSQKEMAEHWGVNFATFQSRVIRGFSLEKSLTAGCIGRKNIGKLGIEDHTGVRFDTVISMCDKWGIAPHAFYARQDKGWSLEKILTTPYIRKRPNKQTMISCEDHLGNKFRSISAMAKKYGIKRNILNYRLRRMSVKEALTL
jgi:hypothetical protein